ncbi:hypothetical protein NHX12_007149 [Muraenolepis orangiensis]|uniref:Uncharacterized protein n=1 Tax=Muraenolepis orangiensis TaxID=630683 RepID=A0A9Q0DPA9_9TELE|nr:hypothetical protein NHX12_007149 [Muraenolepis orangiensis]
MVSPSPTLLHRPATPPTPPPRRSATPTTRITRITPSPTFDRVESLARLKDTTAKLSRGVTPPPILQPHQVTEKRSEIVESPASFHRQIKIESQTMLVSETEKKSECKHKKKVGKKQQQPVVDLPKKQLVDDLPKEQPVEDLPKEQPVDDLPKEQPVDDLPKAEAYPVNVEKTTNTAANKSVPESALELNLSFQDIEQDVLSSEQVVLSVQDKKVLFEEAQKAQINKTYVRKKPIDIPERLGPEVEDFRQMDDPPRVDLSGLVNHFEIPKEGVYTIIEPIATLNKTEVTEADTTANMDILKQELPVFDIQAIKNVFKLDEQSFLLKAEKSHQELVVLNSTTDRPSSKNHQWSRESSRQNTPVPSHGDIAHTESSEPTCFSEASITTEHLSNIDHLGNKTMETKTMKTVSESSKSLSDTKVPFSYADVVKRKTAKRTETYDEASTEELLRTFHKTWTESETVFKSLGYSVTEDKTSKVVTQLTDSSGAGKLLRSMVKKTTNGME